MKRTGLAVVVCLVAVVAVSCKSKDGKSYPPMSLQEFAVGLAEAWCAKAFECCPGGHDRYGATLSECETNQAFMLTNHFSNVAWHDDQAAECLDRWSDWINGATCSSPNRYEFEVETFCSDLYHGTVQVGGSCERDIDCAEGLQCHPIDLLCHVPTSAGQNCAAIYYCRRDHYVMKTTHVSRKNPKGNPATAVMSACPIRVGPQEPVIRNPSRTFRSTNATREPVPQSAGDEILGHAGVAEIREQVSRVAI